jgi:hypothetical protein
LEKKEGKFSSVKKEKKKGRIPGFGIKHATVKKNVGGREGKKG